MVVGKVIQSLREEKDMTQKELAEKIKISYSVMNRIELGDRPARDEEIKRIATVLGVSTDYLLGLTNERINPVDQALSDDPELQAFWNTMREREDLQLMFKKSKTLSPDAIKQIVGIIKLIEDKEDEEFGG